MTTLQVLSWFKLATAGRVNSLDLGHILDNGVIYVASFIFPFLILFKNNTFI